MNEIKLSDSLPVIETEIRQYQNLAGESIFEIGRRLKHVKENDLAHGEFRKWHENLGINKDFASQSIKVSEELNTNVETFRHLGTTALKIITQLPETERTKEHTTSKGETKTPDEMTVKELRELKKQLEHRNAELEERDAQLEHAQRSQDILQNKLDAVENEKPEYIEVEKEVIKEVVPEDYERTKQALEDFKKKFNRESKSAEALREELKKYTEAFSDPNSAYEESQVKRLERESNINAYKLSIGIQKFIEDNAVETYKVSSVIKSNESAKKRLEENIELLEDFTTNIKALINGRIITH